MHPRMTPGTALGAMSATPTRKSHRPADDAAEELEPGALPVEPDEGQVPALLPDDEAQGRTVDPAV